MNILYLTPDLGDAALRRRIAMLEAGGAKVAVAGFSRKMAGNTGTGAAPDGALVLGETANGRMVQRALTVLRSCVRVPAGLRAQSRPDVILARNLEMLAIARRIAGFWGNPRPALVYEVLDIHRMMLGEGRKSRLLRWLEGWLAKPVDLLLTSSPGFVRAYFQPQSGVVAPVRLVENKCLDLGRDHPVSAPFATRPDLPPLVIGWFGILRCARSLTVLDAVTRAAPGRYRVELRGKPALDAMPEFETRIAGNPDLVFHGAYRPEDLAGHYARVHLAWLGDRFEAGGNSDWLLPNRLYEGAAHGAVPLALAGTETARFLADHGLGLIMADIATEPVAEILAGCDTARIAALQVAIAAADPALWTAGRADCAELVTALSLARFTDGAHPAATAVPSQKETGLS